MHLWILRYLVKMKSDHNTIINIMARLEITTYVCMYFMYVLISELNTLYMYVGLYSIYCITQNSGGGKLWQIDNFKNLVGKTLANCNELSLSFLTKTCLLHAMLNLKTTIGYFIIMCSTKMVIAFVVSSVVRG